MNTQAHLIASLVAFGKKNEKSTIIGAIIGGLLPDIAMFLMIPYAWMVGYTDLWSEAGFYHNNEAFDYYMMVMNSIPLWLLLAFMGWKFKKAGMMAMGLGAALHCAVDLGLHHNDGHAHFWPFSNWVYQSPISYWDPAYYGIYFTIFEVILTFGLIVYIYKKFQSKKWAIILLVINILCYLPIIGFYIKHAV